ncbi:hypothetical protein [Pseudomonas orientalis]|uniref:hypothetical protein n=1 Tax=Pseudomonas orientalis TaxID=76758 RepID=UPI000F5862A7|nr:hypothetical protein [Pseudomonas orientalis]AZE90262.1 hypothetical protein C4J97_3569 [Pseudomonas orientalis]
MTEPKHTPGPWLVSSHVVYAANRDDCNRFTAHINSGHLDDDSRTEPDEIKANINLIAAAPDLLAELEETHAALCFTAGYIGSERHKRNAAAIAKATQ